VDNCLAGWFNKARDPIVVVRPDRFVAAVCRPEDLEGVLKKLAGSLSEYQ
jgi:3-(3-hydroxy-phenyl)propionate hydroxylase